MVIVVKAGGRVLAGNLDGLLDDIARLARGGGKLVFVHGGGDMVSEYTRRMGLEPRILVHPSGLRSRYTGPEELEVYIMVMAGLLNKRITAGLIARGVQALGVSGVDLGLLRAERKKRIIIVNERGRKQAIPGGYTGRITGVDGRALGRLLREASVVTLSPLALGMEGELLNVDGDQAASKTAAALKASSLVLLSDVPGVILDDRVLDRIPSAEEARRIAGLVGKGMNRKLLMAAEALENGVGRVVIANGLAENPVESALQGGGTLVEEEPRQ